MTLPDQTVLRGPDGIRWVVQTRAVADGFVTIARRTGCDLRPAAATHSATRDLARQAHARYCAAIKERGSPG